MTNENINNWSEEKILKWYRDYPAINFFYKHWLEPEKHWEIGTKSLQWQGLLEDLQIISSSPKFKVLDIDKSLMKLIVETDNTIRNRQLFFPYIFINSNIEFDRFIIKGILLYEAEVVEKKGIGEYRLVGEKAKHPNDVKIYILYYNKEHHLVADFLSSLRKISDSEYEILHHENEREKSIAKIVLDRALLIACNIIDMVEGNHDDLDIRIIEAPPAQIIKKMHRGKAPIRTRVIIKPKRELLDYINRLGGEHKIYTHKFWVRGHWRHLNSEMYKNMQGKKIWIKPYIKGDGILINKDYTLIDEREHGIRNIRNVPTM